LEEYARCKTSKDVLLAQESILSKLDDESRARKNEEMDLPPTYSSEESEEEANPAEQDIAKDSIGDSSINNSNRKMNNEIDNIVR